MKESRRSGLVYQRAAVIAVGLAVLGGAAWAGVAPAAGQEDAEKDAVLAVVQKFFDTMTAKDAAGAREILIIDGQFSSVADGANGPRVRTSPLATYIERLSSGTRLQEERMWDPVVMIHQRLAMVWTPYDFHVDGELTHCGIDAFSLIKTDAGWKIAAAAYTVEPMGCRALGQPSREPR